MSVEKQCAFNPLQTRLCLQSVHPECKVLMYLPHDVSCSTINMIYVVDQLVISGSFTQENVSIWKFVCITSKELVRRVTYKYQLLPSQMVRFKNFYELPFQTLHALSGT